MSSRTLRSVILVAAFVGSGWLTKNLLLSVNDSVEYWAAARLALHHQNPYNAAAMLGMEQRGGYTRRSTLEMWNPPWILPFIAPLAFFSYALAQKLWLLLGCGCVALSIHLLWKLYGQAKLPSPAAGLAIAIYTPLLLDLAIGQIGPLMLLGVSCFLWFESRRRYALAGASLVLMALKPHLFFLVWIALIFWTLQQKRPQIVLSFFTTSIAISGITFAISPNVFRQYWNFWRHNPVRWNEFPTLAGVLSNSIDNHGIVLALMPAALGVAWLLGHWIRLRNQWAWQRQLPGLLVVSLTTSPYAWPFDGIILLPTLVEAFRSGQKSGRLALATLYVATNIAIVFLVAAGKTLFWYSWVTPVWLLLYFWSHYVTNDARSYRTRPDEVFPA